MDDAPTKITAADASEDAEDEPDSKSEAQTKQEPEETVTVTDGRRRGRRRVMKKKTVQDEEGYLGMFSRISNQTRPLS
jgi:DNA polymerase delta subunit 3